MVVTLPYVRKEIPIVIVFRALGIESDREILEHIVYNLKDIQVLWSVLVLAVLWYTLGCTDVVVLWVRLGRTDSVVLWIGSTDVVVLRYRLGNTDLVVSGTDWAVLTWQYCGTDDGGAPPVP